MPSTYESFTIVQTVGLHGYVEIFGALAGI